MASTPRRSLLSRATGAAKKVASRSAQAEPAKKAAKSAASKAAPAAKKAAPAAKKAVPAAKKTAAAAAKKAPSAAKKTAAVAKKTPAAAKKTAAVAKKTPAAAKKTADVAKKTSSAVKKTAATQRTATKAAVDKVPAVVPAKAIAKKAVAASKAPAKAAATRNAGKLVVLEQEDPWTAAELAEVRDQLKGDVVRLKAELRVVESDLDGLMRASGEGAGNDQADVGSASFERDQEMTIANNARDMLAQTEHALERIANKTYGVCENCGNPIGKNRLMAFPRATLCMTCKTREERR